MILPALKHALDALASAVGIACAMVSAANIITLLIITYWTLRIYQLLEVQGWIGGKTPAKGHDQGRGHDAD